MLGVRGRGCGARVGVWVVVRGGRPVGGAGVYSGVCVGPVSACDR